MLERMVAARTQNPKTVLGFFATVMAIVLAGCTSLCLILGSNPGTVFCVPWVLGLSGAIILGLLVTVIVVMIANPAKLMLTGVSGTEFVEIQRTLGDSLTGRQVRAVPMGAGRTPIVIPNGPELVNTNGDDGAESPAVDLEEGQTDDGK